MELMNTPYLKIDDCIFLPADAESDLMTHNFWAKVFDIHYEKISDHESATSDTSVWKNSYDGTIFSKEEMDDWIANAISKVRTLLTPKSRVLEIGCGNGLIFSSIIDEIASYTGMDIAKMALASITNSKLGKVHKDKITLYELPANAIHTITGNFDLIIINSVAQYFPDLNYFFDFIEKCETKVSSTGALFFGDIRSYDLADKFYQDIARFKFPDDEEKARAFSQRTKKKDNETLYSTGLFKNLPAVFSWIRSIDLSNKLSKYSNEMSRFRFDAILKLAGEHVQHPTPISLVTLSNHVSKSTRKEVIKNHEYQIISLHPKLFKLAQLNEKF
jgi:2-polyprenyl-3-methyl-5-hydroxy-6-metoxy-1,4-benzoquinol methylase